MLHLGYATRLVARPSGRDEEASPSVGQWSQGALVASPRQPVEGENQPVTETQVVCRRQWHSLTAQMHREPSHVAPTMVASVPQTSLILLHSGSAHLTFDKGGRPRRSYLCRPGDLHLVPANRPDYEIEYRSLSPEPLRFFHCYLSDELLAQTAAADAGLDASQLELRDDIILDDPLLTQLGFALARELTQPEAQSELYAETAARMLAMHLVRHHGTVKPREKMREAALSPRVMRRLADFVRAHLARPIALEELAAVAGLSPYHFCRAFRRTTGQSPNAFVIAQRMARAERLLRHTDLTIAQVAAEVGYQSVGHFRLLFQRHLHHRPAEYAKKFGSWYTGGGSAQ